MQTEAAIRLLAELEQPDCPDIDLLAVLKFNYVVACQIYGPLKRKLDSKAEDIEFLLARHPNLRVAYVDTEVSIGCVYGLCVCEECVFVCVLTKQTYSCVYQYINQFDVRIFYLF